MFYTIKEKIEIEIVEKKSKFITNLFPIENQQEAENILKEIKKKYYDAKHHCFAYITFEEDAKIERCSDDGEPSGTAGAPMLALLRGNNLSNVLIIVTRYFGGILLGTGGLVRAYSEATSNAINQATKVEKKKGKLVELEIKYSEIENLKYYCRKNEIKITKEDYFENVKVNLEIREEKLEKLKFSIDNFIINVLKFDEKDNKYI